MLVRVRASLPGSRRISVWLARASEGWRKVILRVLMRIIVLLRHQMLNMLWVLGVVLNMRCILGMLKMPRILRVPNILRVLGVLSMLSTLKMLEMAIVARSQCADEGEHVDGNDYAASTKEEKQGQGNSFELREVTAI